jgi:SAM-dependent methyltransferase
MLEVRIAARDHELTFWEGVARTRWGKYLTQLETEALNKSQLLLPDPTVALEIGCEGGRWSNLLTSLGWKMICTDVSEQALKTCKRRIPSARCIRVSAEETRLPAATAEVKLLLCIEVDPVVGCAWFISEASRVLADGGVLVCTILNARSHRAVVHKLFRRLTPEQRRQTGLYPVNYSDWKRSLQRAGFQVVHERGCCWAPFPRKSNSRLIPFCCFLEKHSGLSQVSSLSPWVVVVAQKVCNGSNPSSES